VNTSIGLVTLGDVPASRLLSLARIAEQEGLSTIWLTDEAFFRGAIPTAVACANATDRLRVGLGVVNPFNHSPVSIAKDFATLQELADGRAVLGIGAAWAPPLEAQGIAWTKALAAVRDTVLIVRTLLAGEECTYEGRKFAVHKVKLDFEPPAIPSSILIAAMFPRALVQAGEIGDGAILSVLCPPGYVAAARNLAQEGARSVGRNLDGFEIVQYVPMEVDDDGDRARRSTKRYLGFLLQHTYGSGDTRWNTVANLGGLDSDDFTEVYERLATGQQPEDAVPDLLLDNLAIAGTPSRCLELLQAYKAAGTTELVAMLPPWCNLEHVITTIGRRLAPEWGYL
jgi:5,10-methylenetetrahydromethanopterin reductase